MTCVSRETAGQRLVDFAVTAIRLPDREELRMLRAIAVMAALDAARRGDSRATFRGSVVHAVRRRADLDASAFVDVRLALSFSTGAFVRVDLSIDADALDRYCVDASCVAAGT